METEKRSNCSRVEACDLCDGGLDVGMNSAHEKTSTVVVHVEELQLTHVHLSAACTDTQLHRPAAVVPWTTSPSLLPLPSTTQTRGRGVLDDIAVTTTTTFSSFLSQHPSFQIYSRLSCTSKQNLWEKQQQVSIAQPTVSMNWREWYNMMNPTEWTTW